MKAIEPCPDLPASWSQLLPPGDRRRQPVEDFIRDAYRSHYGARLSQLPPYLFVLRGAAGDIQAASGVRPAREGKLFLEIYLDHPVEAAVATALGRPVERGEIVEVGSLAVTRAGYARLLIEHLTAFLHERSYRWVTFTAIPALRNAFHRLGLEPKPICVADPGRLGPARQEWGRYYDRCPVVMCGSIGEGYRRLKQPPAPPQGGMGAFGQGAGR